MTRTLLCSLSMLFLVGACAPLRDAQMSAGEAIDARTSSAQPWGRVECGHGQICSEVRVARVDVHRSTEDGSVEVTLENRALEDVAVQIQLEVLDDQGRRVDRTGFHDVALAARQQSVLVLWQRIDEDDELVIRMRSRS
jgi:hypothetical protein